MLKHYLGARYKRKLIALKKERKKERLLHEDRNREAMRSGERNRERGRVRDILGQYHRWTLATKILASLNRRCTVT